MNDQLSIAFSDESLKHTAMVFVECRPDLFRSDFAAWLDKNFHIWREFERRANAMWSTGRKHYGARTIMEVVRYDSDLKEKAGEFKINNNFVPGLARLYACHHADRESFFEFRQIESKAA